MKECPTCQRCFADTSRYCPADGGQLISTLAGESTLDGRYQLRRRLGQGGMGVVYKARHVFLKTTHAIKVILPELVGGDPEFLTRFRQEAMAAAAIRHHNVVSVTDYGVINNSTPFLVMEFIQGKSLHDILQEEQQLSPARALELMEPAAAGVAAAHRRGIVHRDLKPLNIIVEDDLPLNEAVKVLDFGLAKIKSGELLGSFVAAKTTGLMGSPYYMAPEQWSDEEPDRGADIYSLGIILYQMLAGDVPFKGPSIPSIMKKHLMDSPPLLADLGASVPSAVEAVVRHALEKEPENRPATVQMFISELRQAVNSAANPHPRAHIDTDMLATVPRATFDQMAGTISDKEIKLTRAVDALREEQLRSEESRRQAAEEAARRAAEAEERRRREEEEEAARRRAAEAEEERQRAEEAERRKREEAERLAREEAAQRKREEEEALRRAEEERLRLEEEERQRLAAARKQAEEEEARRQQEEEEERQRLEAEAARLKAEEEAESRRRAEEEERQRLEAEAKRRQAEEERQRAEKEERLRREQEERQRIEAEAARKLAEEEEARRREEAERQRIAAAKEVARQQAEEEARRRQEEEDTSAALAALDERQRRRREKEEQSRREEEPPAPPEAERLPETEVEQQVQPGSEEAVPISGPAKRKSPVLALAAGMAAGVVLLLIVGVYIFLSRTPASSVQVNQPKASSNSPSPDVKGSPLKPPPVDMAALSGGTFQMGRNDVDPASDEHGNEYPAHTVTVKPFQMDKTEVTNAEYAEFVKATGRPAPRDETLGDKEAPYWKPWSGGKPPAGQERWPVRNVSFADAEAFAAWRSQRDGVTCRLPTEEEWEYAARSGGAFRFYPWGDEWGDGRANVEAKAPQPVGSLAPGASREGALDLIGNVWEWTASEASIYAGNNERDVPKNEKGHKVIRGGSYQSTPSGSEAITATSRTWLPPTTKDPRLGFRLVRDAP